jgi:hypothetical protein
VLSNNFQCSIASTENQSPLYQEEALKDANLRGYFSSAKTLADYAEVILHIKKKHSADSSPVIVFGGSYGGSK